MDREIRPHVFTAIAALSCFVIQATIGGWLESTGSITAEDVNIAAYKFFNFSLFLLLSFSIVRPFIRLFVTMQAKIGNGDRASIRFVRTHERAITWGVWGFWSIGLAIALPKIVAEGFFK